MTLEKTLFFTGLLHFTQIPAVLYGPRMLNWKEDLGRLQPINRAIYKVVSMCIVLVVLGLGTVTMLAAGEIAAGGVLATAFTCFAGLLWCYRLSMQIFVYPPVWPGGWLGRASHYGLIVIFTFYAGIYLTVFAGHLLL